MMTSFRPNKNRRVKKFLLGGVLGALFLFFLLGWSSSSIFISSSVSAVFTPFLKAGNSVNNWFDKKLSYFKNKQSLEEESHSLSARVEELESAISFCQVLESQNNELREIFSRKDDQNYIIAFAVSRPPQSPYDVLVLDAGSEQGIQNGMEVTAYGNILIGYISEVFSKTSKVKLISFPKEEINVLLQNANVQVIAIGHGSGNFEIDLPKAVEVQEGDKVVTMSTNQLLLGIVEKIISNPSDPFQKILFRLPVNIQELNYVMIKK